MLYFPIFSSRGFFFLWNLGVLLPITCVGLFTVCPLLTILRWLRYCLRNLSLQNTWTAWGVWFYISLINLFRIILKMFVLSNVALASNFFSIILRFVLKLAPCMLYIVLHSSFPSLLIQLFYHCALKTQIGSYVLRTWKLSILLLLLTR